ncbi:MAG: acyltransferase family protein [Limnohabitans sp.]|jgi:peptidoglycan/LPS O-acetylase OafA/YrhL
MDGATSALSAERPAARFFLIDLLKAAGCLLIVLHHLAFYGPMADVVATRWPLPIEMFSEHGRLAVQIFLVCSGFLTACVLQGKQITSWHVVWRGIGRRYLRLSVPLLAALALTVLISEFIRPIFAHDSLSPTPTWKQVLAHLFFLQHLLDIEALSAGVWYVAVDMQLYASALLAVWGAQQFQRRGLGPAVLWEGLFVLVMVVMSLTLWTHREVLDDTALYFWGAYGMGWLASYTRQWRRAALRCLPWLLLALLCLVFDARGRALTAWSAACLLGLWSPGWLRPGTVLEGWQLHAIQWLSRVSYSVFVVHFGVCLLVSALIQDRWPDSMAMNAMGMVLAMACSLLMGDLLHRLTERGTTTGWRWAAWASTLLASAGLAMLVQG